MLATVHLSDQGIRSLPGWRKATSRVGAAPGLRYSAAMIPAPLGTGIPRPQLGRLAFIGFWDDLGAATVGFSDTLLGEDFDGLRFDLEPVRAVGSWPGLPGELPTAPAEVHEGPAVIVTIGRLRLLQARRFFATSGKAETHILASPGLTWGTGLAAPERRTLATLSWWHDQEAMGESARGHGAHRDATAAQAEKDFHHESAFIRFRPLRVSGELPGKNGVHGLAVA